MISLIILLIINISQQASDLVKLYKQFDIDYLQIGFLDPYNLMLALKNKEDGKELVIYQWAYYMNKEESMQMSYQQSVSADVNSFQINNDLIYLYADTHFSIYSFDIEKGLKKQKELPIKAIQNHFLVNNEEYIILVNKVELMLANRTNGVIIQKIKNKKTNDILHISEYYSHRQFITRNQEYVTLWQLTQENQIEEVKLIYDNSNNNVLMFQYLSTYQSILIAFKFEEVFKVGFLDKEGNESSFESFGVVSDPFIDYCIDFNQIYLHILTSKSIVSWSMMTRLIYSQIEQEDGIGLISIKQSLFFTVVRPKQIIFMLGYECGQDLEVTPFGTCIQCPLDIVSQCLKCFENIDNLVEVQDEKQKQVDQSNSVRCIQCEYLKECQFCGQNSYSRNNKPIGGLCQFQCPNLYNKNDDDQYCSPPCYFNQIFLKKIGCVDCRYAFYKCELCDHEKCLKCQIGYYLKNKECVLIERPTWLRVQQIINTFRPENGRPIIGILFNKRLHPDVISKQIVQKPINMTLQHKVEFIELSIEVYREYSNNALTFILNSNVSFSNLNVILTINEIDQIYSSKNVPLYPKENQVYQFHIDNIIIAPFSIWVEWMMTITEKLAGKSYLDEDQTAQFLRVFRRAGIFNMIQSSNQRFFSLQILHTRKDIISSETIRMIGQLSAPKHILPHERNYYLKRYMLHNDDVTEYANQAPYSFCKMGMPLDYSINGYPVFIALFLIFVAYFSIRLVIFQLQNSKETELSTEDTFQQSESIGNLIENWFSYEIQFKTIWTYEDEVLMVDSIFNFLILLLFDSYITLFFVSVSLWSSQSSFETTFESLSSTLLFLSLALFLVYYGILIFSFYSSVTSINVHQKKFVELENLLKEQFTNRRQVSYLEINVHLKRILSFSALKDRQEKQQQLASLTKTDKYLFHCFIFFLKLKNKFRVFFSKYLYLILDLKHPSLDSIFNYNNDLTPFEVQLLLATNQISEEKSQIKPIELKIISFHLFMFVKKIIYGIVIVVVSFHNSPQIGVIVLLIVEFLFLILKVLLNAYSLKIQYVLSISADVLFMVGLITLLIEETKSQQLIYSQTYIEDSTQLGIVTVTFLLSSYIINFFLRVLKLYCLYSKFKLIQKIPISPSFTYPDSEINDIIEDLKKNQHTEVQQIQNRSVEVENQEQKQKQFIQKEEKKVENVTGRLNFPQLKRDREYQQLEEIVPDERNISFNDSIKIDIERVDWTLYNVSFCQDPLIEYELYILVTLFDKRVCYWEEQKNEQEIQNYMQLRKVVQKFLQVLTHAVREKEKERLYKMVRHLKTTNIYTQLEYSPIYFEF